MTGDSEPSTGDRETFQAAAADADCPVVVRTSFTLDVDDIDPLTAFDSLGEGDYAFLLESAEKTAASDPDGAFRPSHAAEDRHARYSFVGYAPDAVVTIDDTTSVEPLTDARVVDYLAPGGPDDGDVLDRLRGGLPDLPRRNFPDTDRQLLSGGLVGFLAYDAVYDLWLEEVGVEKPETPLPDAEFVLTTKTLVFDHAEDAVNVVCTPVVTPDDDPAEIFDALEAEAQRVATVLREADAPETGGFRKTGETAGPRDEYEDAVRTAKQAIHDGEIYQGVVSRTRELRGDVDPRGLYAALRDVNPSPYMYLLSHDDHHVVGASPETLVSVRGRQVLNNPIAGTCPRGEGPVEDRRLAGEMLADEKERAEHTMLVDLARNDVRRVSAAGSVRVPEFMNVLKYSHVQHIESTVTGELRDDQDAFDAARSSFPAGTLSGAPKVRAMEIIHELERTQRGVYGGGLGYFSWNGDAELAIVIRTALVETAGTGAGASAERAGEDVIRVRAGAGIVADSDPASEYEETEKKMGGVLDALDRITGSGDDATPPLDAEQEAVQ